MCLLVLLTYILGDLRADAEGDSASDQLLSVRLSFFPGLRLSTTWWRWFFFCFLSATTIAAPVATVVGARVRRLRPLAARFSGHGIAGRACADGNAGLAI